MFEVILKNSPILQAEFFLRFLFVSDCVWVSQTLAAVLNKKGHYARVVPDKHSTVWNYGSKYLVNSTDDTYKLMPTLRSIVMNRDIDVINSNNYTSWVGAEISRRLLGFSHIVILHGSDIRELMQDKIPDYKKHLLLQTLKSADAILATTPDLLKYSNIIGRQILHLPQPINTEVFTDSACISGSLFGDPVIFSPTRLQTIKGAANIIELLKQIVKAYPHSHIYQIAWGDQEYLSLLSRKVSSKNLTLVKYLPRDHLPSWYASVDVVIGQMETGILSNIELEAMSCKTPVVVYDTYYDYGCPLKNPENAFEMAYSVISDRSFRRTLIEKGLRIINEKHDMNRVTELYLKYVNNLHTSK
jgi:glycosyltransferase involved in cell wall biosynthesis